MRFGLTVVLALLGMWATGCGGPDSAFTGPSYLITGALEKPTSMSDYALIELDKIKIESVPQKKTVDAGHYIETEHVLKFEIRNLPDTNFEALLGPTFGMPTDAGEGYVTTTPQVGCYLDGGWLYMVGTGVSGTTEYTSFGATGSKMAVNIIKSPSVIHRVYYIQGTTGWFDVAGATPKMYFPLPGMYVDIRPDLTFTGPLNIPAGDAFYAELNRAIEAAKL